MRQYNIYCTKQWGEAMGWEPRKIRGAEGKGRQERKEKEVGVQNMREAGEIEGNYAIMLKGLEEEARE